MSENPPKKSRSVSSTYGLAYTCVLPMLKDIAREHGYCLAVHGSMATDLDLLAVPWIEEASEPEVLIEAICECVKGQIVATPQTDEKPHGRLGWNILPLRNDSLPRLDLVPWLDISVMPRIVKEKYVSK